MPYQFYIENKLIPIVCWFYRKWIYFSVLGMPWCVVRCAPHCPGLNNKDAAGQLTLDGVIYTLMYMYPSYGGSEKITVDWSNLQIRFKKKILKLKLLFWFLLPSNKACCDKAVVLLNYLPRNIQKEATILKCG